MVSGKLPADRGKHHGEGHKDTTRSCHSPGEASVDELSRSRAEKKQENCLNGSYPRNRRGRGQWRVERGVVLLEDTECIDQSPSMSETRQNKGWKYYQEFNMSRKPAIT